MVYLLIKIIKIYCSRQRQLLSVKTSRSFTNSVLTRTVDWCFSREPTSPAWTALTFHPFEPTLIHKPRVTRERNIYQNHPVFSLPPGQRVTSARRFYLLTLSYNIIILPFLITNKGFFFFFFAKTLVNEKKN